VSELEVVRIELAVAIRAPADFGTAIDAAHALCAAYTTFGLLLTVEGALHLDSSLDRRPDLRRELRSRRPVIGTWCRAIAYVFESERACAANSRHVRARALWGTQAAAFSNRSEARAWLDREVANAAALRRALDPAEPRQSRSSAAPTTASSSSP
jgi:hypothetical protein